MKIQFLENTRFKTLEHLSKTFWNALANFLEMSVKFKESTQWYKFFYGATALAMAVYHKNMTKNMD